MMNQERIHGGHFQEYIESKQHQLRTLVNKPLEKEDEVEVSNQKTWLT
jgi:hypothetical protein